MRNSIILLLAAAWLVLGCSGGQTYRQVLDRAEWQNQNYKTVTGIDSIKMAVEDVDRHGSANEQVRAHYLLGCAYRDAGEAMKALEAYHDAADRADTTGVDCDYGLLMRVHGQTAMLFKKLFLPNEMLDELEKQRHYAQLAGDDLSAITAVERSADAYYMLGKTDSFVNIQMRASDLYLQYGFREAAALAAGPIIDEVIERGDTAWARRCIERYETSKTVFKDGEILPHKAEHYYSKGKYCMAVGKLDSAAVYFRKMILPGRDPKQLEAGYRGLFLLYRKLGNLDSISKYADLQYEQTIPALADKNKESYRQMQALYNYTSVQRQAEQQADKARYRDWIIVGIVSVVVIAILLLRAQKGQAPVCSMGTVLSEFSSWAALDENSGRTVPIELPSELSTPKAMKLWRKAQQAGFVDDNFQPLLSRTQSALLADVMAEHLGIRQRWKIFETFWHRNNMRSDYNLALSQRQSLDFRDKLKNILI